MKKEKKKISDRGKGCGFFFGGRKYITEATDLSGTLG